RIELVRDVDDAFPGRRGDLGSSLGGDAGALGKFCSLLRTLQGLLLVELFEARWHQTERGVALFSRQRGTDGEDNGRVTVEQAGGCFDRMLRAFRAVVADENRSSGHRFSFIACRERRVSVVGR